jgi:hypothetical protein
MNTVQKGSFAASIVLKVANMKKEDSFVIYPYSGGDTIYLQSGKRWIEANLRTGEAKIIKKGMEYANSWKMAFYGHIDFVMPKEAIESIQAHLWHNSGLQGCTVMKYENKELFSEA